jgi:hypothetical protein
MMAEDLHRFVLNEQKDNNITLENCAKIITEIVFSLKEFPGVPDYQAGITL